MHDDRKCDAKDGAIKMRVMIYVVAPLTGHIDGIGQEHDGIEDGRYGYEEQIDGLPGFQEDKGKYDGRYGPGCPQAPVVIVIAVFNIGRQQGNDQGTQVQNEIGIVRKTQIPHIIHLHYPSKKIEGEHIESKVHIVGVYETAGNEPVILPFFGDGRRPENKVVNNLGAAETGYGYEAGNNNDANRYLEHPEFFLKIGLNPKRKPALGMMIFFILEDGACPVNLFGQNQSH
jgi:hypothetical protein